MNQAKLNYTETEREVQELYKNVVETKGKTAEEIELSSHNLMVGVKTIICGVNNPNSEDLEKN